MIKIHVLGDGDRDAATVPPLVESILGSPIRFEFFAWTSPELRVSGGYARKLLLAVTRAIDDNSCAVVAVIDKDKETRGERLKKLQEGRNRHRINSAPFPTALGEARPHGEAWLLADRVAVRAVLQLDGGIEIPSIAKTKDPKRSLDELINQSPRVGIHRMDLLREIAKQVEFARSVHAGDTGFDKFVAEIRSELKLFVKTNPG